MVVDEYVSRCLDVGSTPTGSIMNRYTVDFFQIVSNYFSVLVENYSRGLRGRVGNAVGV